MVEDATPTEGRIFEATVAEGIRIAFVPVPILVPNGLCTGTESSSNCISKARELGGDRVTLLAEEGIEVWRDAVEDARFCFAVVVIGEDDDNKTLLALLGEGSPVLLL